MDFQQLETLCVISEPDFAMRQRLMNAVPNLGYWIMAKKKIQQWLNQHIATCKQALTSLDSAETIADYFGDLKRTSEYPCYGTYMAKRISDPKYVCVDITPKVTINESLLGVTGAPANPTIIETCFVVASYPEGKEVLFDNTGTVLIGPSGCDVIHRYFEHLKKINNLIK